MTKCNVRFVCDVQAPRAATCSSTICPKSSGTQSWLRCLCPLATSSAPRSMSTAPPTRASASVRLRSWYWRGEVFLCLLSLHLSLSLSLSLSPDLSLDLSLSLSLPPPPPSLFLTPTPIFVHFSCTFRYLYKTCTQREVCASVSFCGLVLSLFLQTCAT